MIYSIMKSDGGVPLIQELYSKIKSQGLKPKTIVDYTREAFVFAPGDFPVRYPSGGSR